MDFPINLPTDIKDSSIYRINSVAQEKWNFLFVITDKLLDTINRSTLYCDMTNISTLFRFVIISIFLLISGCSTAPIHDTVWPQDMPPKAYFTAIYEQDLANKAVQTPDEYYTWIVRFYQGWELYRRGWNRMINELVVEIKDPAQAEEARVKTTRLGKIIAGEWAKKINSRTVFTRHVAIWGNALLESIERDEALLLIDKISADVDNLIDHKIAPEVITAARYYPPDEDDSFF